LLEARLTLQQGDQQTAFVSVQADILADVLDMQGKFNLTDSTFKLATSLDIFPPPIGNVSGTFNSTFSWPVTLEPAWIADNVTLHARLGGSLHMPFEEYEMSVSIPNSYALEYESAKIVGAGDMNIELHTSDIEVAATLHSLKIDISATPTLFFSADVTGSNESIVVAGALASELSIENTAGPSVSGPSLSGPTTFSGQVLALQQNIPVAIKAQLNLAGKTLTANGVMSASLFNDAAFHLTHDTSTSIGHLAVADKVHIQQPLLASLPIQWEQDYDLDAGVLDVSADLRWQASAQIAAILDLNLTDGRGHYEDYRASTISAQLQLTNSDVTNVEGWAVAPTNIHIGRVDVGFPIYEVTAHLRLNQSDLTITEASATLLGGSVTATTAIYDTNLGTTKFNLFLKDIDLAQILALEGEDITGTGTISGMLPISIHNNQVLVHRGELTAKAPGGTIRLSSELTAPTGQVGLDFAVRALEDFRYTILDSQISYAENGDLALAIKLLGNNPEIENGRAIHYNLNVTENIPTLLQSLRLQDKVIEQMERKAKK
ncbi:MAG: hypothetical protein GXP16_08270, partial [Gammaproteobacteria bacterium]|nr:hypothetical protein [Gammaproteobacteria bacterium]